VDGLQIKKVVVCYIDTYAKVEARVTAIDDLVIAKLHKIRVLGVSDRDEGVNLFDELLLLLGLEAVVPLGETGFARPILDQDELDRHPGVLGVTVGRWVEVYEAGD